MRYIRSVLELHMLAHVCIQLCINALLLLLTGIKRPFAVVHAPESAARQLDRDMRNEVRTTGKRPRDAYTDMIASVPKKFKTSDTQESVIVQLPAYHEVRCQLSRHRTHSCIPILDPLSIPDALQITLRGRDALDGDPNKNERFLLHCGQGGTYRVRLYV